MKNTRKGFTIVELVIVIAVVAILAAVLIPTFVSLVNKANVANDTALIKNLNTALASDADGCKTMHEALAVAADFGYDVAKINAKGTNNEILWDSVNNVFCYFDSEKNDITYIPDSISGEKGTGAQLWVISDTVSTTYSTYYVGGENITSDTTTSICVATNGTNLVINAPNADVYHYGDVADLTIEAVAPNSYHEYGRVTGMATVSAGHVVIENGGSIGTMVVKTTSVSLSGDFGIIMGTDEVITALGEVQGEKVTVSADALEGVDTAVAMIDGVFYDDLHAALEVANGKEIILVRDIGYATNKVFTINKDQVITIDLNGHIIAAVEGDAAVAAVITNNGTLTIKDSVGTGKITSSALNPDKQAIPTYASNTITNEGTLVLEGGTIENTTAAGAAYAVDDKGKFTMNGGELVGNNCALRIAKYNQDNVEFTMNGGTITAKKPAWIQLPGSDFTVAPTITVIINDGTFVSTKASNADNDLLYTYTFGNSHANTSVTINGGKFIGGTVSIGADYTNNYKDLPTLNIVGGTFDYDVLQWTADGSSVVYEAK